ncbi:UNVERIFIED_CONTAM: hypothetical protein Sangu_3133800 [Sesamum angustifolium]|uniref:Uncharacterized protein n=1 Tax=Sesamum angustifolium TaxID=2727405 RepID=A0AAW2K0Q6_9LAMI
MQYGVVPVFPRLDEDGDIIGLWNINLEFCRKKTPSFQGFIVKKEMWYGFFCFVTITLGDQCNPLLFQSLINGYPVVDDPPSEDGDVRNKQLRPEGSIEVLGL